VVAEEGTVDNAGRDRNNDRKEPEKPIITPNCAATEDCVVVEGQADRVIHSFSMT